MWALPARADWPARLTTPASTTDWQTTGFNSRTLGDQFIYLDRPTSTGPIEMYTRSPDGGDEPQKFSIPLPTSSWDVLSWSRTTDPSKLFVTTGRNAPEKYYWVDPDDPTDVELINPIMPTGASEIMALNSTNTYGLVQRYYGAVDGFGLSSVSLTGGQPVHHYVPPDRRSGYQNDRLSPDGQRLTYFVSQYDAPHSRLFSSPLDGSAPPVELYNSGSDATASYSHAISPDSNHVLYTPGDGLYTVPIAGGTPIRLSPTLSAGATLTSYSGINDHAIFAGHFNESGRRHLYSAPMDGGGPAILLSDDSAITGGLEWYTTKSTAQGDYVLFKADSAVPDRLFARLYDAAGPTIPLGDPAKHGSVSMVLRTSNHRVVYLAETVGVGDDYLELFSTSLADPENVVATGARILRTKLSSADYDISDDGNWFLYGDDYTSTSVYSTIQAVATDGSVAPFEVVKAPFIANDESGSSVGRIQLGSLANADTPYIFAAYNSSPAIPLAVYSVDFQPPTLPGDFNDDGIVDTADYIVWRKNVGSAPGTLPNDPYFRLIGDDQYNTWRANLGRTDATSGTGGSVPEPTSLLSAIIAAVAVALARHQHRAR